MAKYIFPGAEQDDDTIINDIAKYGAIYGRMAIKPNKKIILVSYYFYKG